MTSIIDTQALAGAGSRAASAARLLDGVSAPLPDPAGAAGDPALADAVATLWRTWAPLHRSLQTDLELLAHALHGAAGVLDDGETAAVQHLTGVLVPASAPRTHARPV
ncbi:hypothetical protein [Oerskovia flava]|uniref:hypothetical protein n=1 Tax=Oerskovia flava TaxID=2986422 RepID=UPI00223F4CCD|nr:hypothetical protein [Oerskovia sp. JB1-3-2]